MCGRVLLDCAGAIDYIAQKFYRANSAFLFDWVCLYIIVWCILYTTISKLRFCPKKCTFFPRVGSFWTFRMIAKSKEMW